MSESNVSENLASTEGGVRTHQLNLKFNFEKKNK